MRNATPAGLPAGGAGKAKSQKEPPPGEKPEKLPEPPGRLAQGGEKGGGGGKEEVAEGSAEALAVRVAQRGHEMSERFCFRLELGFLRRARDLPQAQVVRRREPTHNGFA